MTHDLDRGTGRMITGDDYRDDFDINNPRHFARAMQEVTAAGIALPDVLTAKLKREKAELERQTAERAALPDLVAALEEARDRAQAAARQAERDRTITFPSTPASDTDALVIGKTLDQYPGGESTEQEIDGKLYRFSDHREVVFVPRAVKAAWPHRRGLPGRVFASWPADLLGVYRGDFTRVKSGGLQNTGPGFSDVEVNEDGLLAAASRIVRGCSHRPLLELWLAGARAAGDESNQVLAKVIDEQIKRIGVAEVAA